MSTPSSSSSSSSSSSVSSSSSPPPHPTRRRKRPVSEVDGISETAIARRLGRRLRSMTQLLREDTPQASAILTTGLSTITSRSKQQHQSNKNEEQQQHTTNIGDIIKSAGATTLDEVVDDNSDDENDDDGDMAGLLPYIDNNIGSSTQVDRSRGNTTTSNLPQLRFDESGNIVLVDDEGAGNRGQEDNTNNTIGDNSLRLMHTRVI